MGFSDRYPRLAALLRRALMWGSRQVMGVDPYKVVFCCYKGSFYGDSPRCISERLHQRCPEAKIVWMFTGGCMARVKGALPEYVKPVLYKRGQSLVEQATARVWVDNYTKNLFMRFSKGRQFYVQTWHGDRAIKKICYDLGLPGDDCRLEERCDRVVTASAFGERMYRTAFRYGGEYIKAGSPRNDILVRNDPEERRRVREGLGVGERTGLLLYAPTYREEKDVLPRRVQMDLDRTLRCLEETTGKPWICLFRAHYKSAGIDLDAVKDRIVDVTKYEEMAELLLAADMVLTDYSSCALDYIVRDMPALFYIADWDSYRSDPGVYFDVRESPLLTASNQDELEALIRGLTPQGIRENCAAIRDYFGYYETGRATDAVCDYIIGRLGGGRRERRADA